MEPKSVIWAPWRMAYIDGYQPEVAKGGCLFCGALSAPDDEEALQKRLILARTRYGGIIMNLYPYNNGHIMVFPREHSPDPTAIPMESYLGLSRLWRDALSLLRQQYQSDGFNVGLNLGSAAGAGIADHFHVHLVPRWNGDTNFMPVLGDVKVMPEHIEQTWKRLRPIFRQLENDDSQH